MLAILKNQTYRHLLLAQVIALVGTGLATVALGLLAFELAGENAGAVLGTALAIKMVAYVTVAQIASAFAERVPRRAMLVALDLVRAAVAVLLPFVTGLDNQATALALAAFGGGSMVAALALPKLLESIPDRSVMLAGAALLVAATLTAAALPGFGWLLPLWFVLGVGYSTAQTPSGRLLRPLREPGRPPGAVRRAVCAVPRLLADRLSARRLGRCCPRAFGRGDHPRRTCRRRDRHRVCNLASRRPGGRRT